MVVEEEVRGEHLKEEVEEQNRVQEEVEEQELLHLCEVSLGEVVDLFLEVVVVEEPGSSDSVLVARRPSFPRGKEGVHHDF